MKRDGNGKQKRGGRVREKERNEGMETERGAEGGREG